MRCAELLAGLKRSSSRDATESSDPDRATKAQDMRLAAARSHRAADFLLLCPFHRLGIAGIQLDDDCGTLLNEFVFK